MVTTRWVIPRSMLHSLYRVLQLLGNTQLRIRPDYSTSPGDSHAFSILVVRRTEPRLLRSTGELHVITEEKFSTILVKYVKTTSSRSTKKVRFGVIFATNLRTSRILPPGHSVLHCSKMVVHFVPRPNSTTCPNAAQDTPLRNCKQLQNVNPPTHQPPATYILTNPNTCLTRAMHHKGPR